MKAAIYKTHLEEEFDTPEKCFIVEVLNNANDPELSIARARVEPGVITAWHKLEGTAERYYILEGMGLIEVGDLPPQQVTVGDVVLIPPGCRQRIRNVANSDLVFLAICTPRFHQKNYLNVCGGAGAVGGEAAEAEEAEGVLSAWRGRVDLEPAVAGELLMGCFL